MTTNRTPCVTDAAVYAAAIQWCGEKDRETSLDDIRYFQENWSALPGLRRRVETFARFEAEIRQSAEAASSEREAILREALWLFREFTLRNATQWEVGANHHHPIYPMIAELIGEMGGITSGEYHRFVQPENREALTRTATDAEGGA